MAQDALKSRFLSLIFLVTCISKSLLITQFLCKEKGNVFKGRNRIPRSNALLTEAEWRSLSETQDCVDLSRKKQKFDRRDYPKLFHLFSTPLQKISGNQMEITPSFLL